MSVRRFSAVCAIVIGFIGSAASADDGVLLQYKFAKGDKLIYKSTSEMKQSQTLMGMTFENEMNNEAITTFTVDEIDDKGNYRLTMKGERLKVKSKFGQLGGEYEFDSQSSERDKASVIGAAVTPLYERLATASYQATISATGEVLEVKGYADLISDVLKENPLAAQFAGGGTDAAAKLALQEQFPKIGKVQIKVGASWDVPAEVELPGLGKMRGKAVYRYVGPDTVNARKTAKLEVSGEMSMELDIDMGGAKVTGTIASTDTSGVVQFDLEKGRVLSSHGSASIGGDLNVAAGGMNFPIRNEQRMTNKLELLDKLPD